VDGPGHARPRTQQEDQERDATLEAAGYQLLRVTAQDIDPVAAALLGGRT
jgi:very-short-patch-repair endonuclease